MEQAFIEKLGSLKDKSKSVLMTCDEYSSLIEEMKVAAASEKKTPRQHLLTEAPMEPVQGDVEGGPSAIDEHLSSDSDAEREAVHQSIMQTRGRAVQQQTKQAERMLKRSRVVQAGGSQGDNVIVPIPLVDRGKGDPRNLIGVILDRNENDLYKIAVSAGVIKGRFSRNQFDLCKEKLYTEKDMNTSIEVSLRQAVHKESLSGGQGYAKCNCVQSSKQCNTNRCKCFKNKVKCNSRCHNSLTCPNKK